LSTRSKPVCPHWLPPQQATVPPVLRAQVFLSPATTLMNDVPFWTTIVPLDVVAGDAGATLPAASATVLEFRVTVRVPTGDETPLESLTTYGPAPDPVTLETTQLVELPPRVMSPVVKPVTSSEKVIE